MIVRGAREDLACENDELELKCDYLYCTSAQALTLSNPNPNPNPIPIHISLNLTHTTGTATLSFVDTMLSSTDKSTTFVIVDKQPAAGGHWNVAYPFVTHTLHQPSGTYTASPLSRLEVEKRA